MRQLNILAQQVLGTIMNPYAGKHASKADRQERAKLVNPVRIAQLQELVETVKEFAETARSPSPERGPK